MAGPPPPPPPPPGGPKPPGAPGAPPPPPGSAIPPPPTKRKPVIIENEAFDFTAEDVKAAASDLLRMLPEAAPIESTGPVLAALLVGDKDCKSIASIAVHTTHCPGLPRPEGSKVVIIAWDTQSQSSWENFLAKSGVSLRDEGERPFFIEMRKPWGRYQGLTDSEDPANGAYMILVFREVLKGLRARRDIGGLVIDHYGMFIESRGGDYALYMAGVREFSALDPSDWIPRKKMWEGTDEMIRSAPIPGGWVVGNGYRNRDDGELVTVIGAGGKRSQAIVEAKWTRRVFANYPVIVQSYHTIDEDAKHGWHGDCTTGRVGNFQAGAKRDLFNRNLGAFTLPS